MATLPSYCLGKVKRREEGRRLSLRRYLCIIHPLSLTAWRMCVDVLTGVCFYVGLSLEVIGWDWRGDWGETGAIIALSSAMHAATLCLYIKQLCEFRGYSVNHSCRCSLQIQQPSFKLYYTKRSKQTGAYSTKWVCCEAYQQTSGQWTGRLASSTLCRTHAGTSS